MSNLASSPRVATRTYMVLAVGAMLSGAIPAGAQTYVSGTIDHDTTWSLAGSPYVLVGTVAVDSGVTLSVASGVEVRFDTSGYSLLVNGTLTADAASFTGNYANIQVLNGAMTDLIGSFFAGGYVAFSSGSSGTVTCCVLQRLSIDSSADLSVQNCSIASTVSLSSGCMPIVTGNTFSGPTPISLSPNADVSGFSGNVFTNSDPWIRVGGTVPQSWALGLVDGLGRYDLGGDLVINNGVTLTLAPGVTLRSYFCNGPYRDIVVDGLLQATNATIDLDNYNPYYNYCAKVWVRDGGQLSMSNGSVTSTGYVSFDDGAQCNLTGTDISCRAVDFASGSSGTVTCCVLQSLSINSNADVWIANNDLSGASVSVNGTAFSPVRMQYNWWGSTFPSQISTKITDCHDNASLPCVDFTPYLWSPPAPCVTYDEDYPSLHISLDHLWVWDVQTHRFVDPGGPVTIYTGQPTYILAHGWDGDLSDTNHPALSSIGCAISAARPQANILAWDWAEAANPDGIPTYQVANFMLHLLRATHDPGIGLLTLLAADDAIRDARLAADNARTQGNALGKALADLRWSHGGLGTEVHLIGHSHGGGLVARAADIMDQNGYRANSVTMLETPKVYLGEYRIVDTVCYLRPDSVDQPTVIYYADWARGGAGGPSARFGVTNVELNAALAPSEPILHFFIAGPDTVAGGCTMTPSWFPEGVWNPQGGGEQWMVFNVEPEPISGLLLSPGSFPPGDFAEAGTRYVFAPQESRHRETDETAGLIESWHEPFDTPGAWSGSRALIVEGMDPNDSLNHTALLQEAGDACFFQDIEWPPYASALLFDYMFLEPRGQENLTVYLNGEIVYYDSADTTLAGTGLTSSGAIFLAPVAGTTSRLNFVLRTDGEPGGAVLLDNLRVYSLPIGDLDQNERVDFGDFALFSACFQGPGVAPPSGCDAADVTADRAVDMLDFVHFQRAFTGP